MDEIASPRDDVFVWQCDGSVVVDMAMMYPQHLPASVLKNKMLRGEVDTYKALSALPDEFEIFYDRCVNTKHGSRAYKRRIDFIIIHETLGFLAIEVKGGKIRLRKGEIQQYHHTSREWKSITPHRQVEKATIELIKDCRNDGANYWIPDDICVIFPNILRREITNLPHTLPGATLCADDLAILATQIPKLFSRPATGQAWSRDSFLDMRRRLQNMPEVNWGAEAEESEEQRPKKRFSGTRLTKKAARQHYPVESDTNFVSTSLSGQGVSLKWWQVVAAIIVGLLAAFLMAEFI